MNTPWSMIVTGLVCGVLVAVAAGTEELDDRERKQRIREIEQKQRELANFHDRIVKLERAARQSSNSSRRSAVEALERSMGEIIAAVEAQMGSDHRITQHDSEVDEVTTRELEEPKGVRTRKRFLIATGDASLPPGYVRLARQQAIYASCQTIREQAIGNHHGALERYRRLVEEFAGLMEREIVELMASLPAEDQARLDAIGFVESLEER